MEPFFSPLLKGRGWWRQVLAAGLLQLLLLAGRDAGAQYLDTFSVGSGVPSDNSTEPLVNYTTPINATNFFNDVGSTFEFDLGSSSTTSWLPNLYSGWSYTLNYTNHGEMDSATGFRFDLQNGGGHFEAANFYNDSAIFAGTTASAVLLTQSSSGTTTSVSGYGGIYVFATNIFNNGDIAIGYDGIAKFIGDNIDFTRGTTAIASQTTTTTGTSSSAPNVSVTSQTDRGTNKWNPSTELTATTAYGPLNASPLALSLSSSIPYFNISPADNSGTNLVVTMVFLEDLSGGVVTNVYFGGAAGGGGSGGGSGGGGGNGGGGNGQVHVEWGGVYLEPASGQLATNYLYLTDDFTSISTNLLRRGTQNPSLPANYTLTETTGPLGYAPAAVAGFVPGLFSATNIVSTNIYSYFDAQFITTSVSLDSPTYGTLALTNLPGRVEITANKALDLTLADLSGMNYLKLSSPNQFTYSQLSIATPYADLYLGNTNGSMVISNLIQSALPVWSGTLEAWSTRWSDTNNASGTNYEFRALLVYSILSPTSPSYVQDFELYCSNNVVISDALNILRNLSLNCTSLYLTSNDYGNGADSPEGELILGSTDISWANSVPRLLNLVNDGYIYIPNSAKFVSTTNIVAVTPAIPAVAAAGTLSEVAGRTNVLANNQVTIGTNKYVFVNTLTNTVPNQVKRAATFDGSMSNLVAAINRAAGAGTNYSTNTHANPFAVAGPLSSHAFVITAVTNGMAGNSIVTTNSPATTNLTWNGHVALFGGSNAVAAVTNVTPTAIPYQTLINHGTIYDQGSVISATLFQNSGYFENGSGSFSLQSQAAVLGNGEIYALYNYSVLANGQIYALSGGSVSITSGSLVASNTFIETAQSLVLTVTNTLSDGFQPATGLGGGNYFYVYGASGNGFSLPILPAVADLLGTTFYSTAISNKVVVNTWSGRDLGATPAGYSNNAAVGVLSLDALGAGSKAGHFYFTGTGTNNALYVDVLELADAAAILDASANVPALTFNTNMVIYYSQAFINGQSVAEKLNHKNGNRLRWVPSYAGYYSSTYVFYPDGSYAQVNAALAQSTTIDSNGNGVANAFDPAPFFVPGQVNFSLSLTNRPPQSVRIQWDTIPNATNFIYYRTNLTVGAWLPFTNFNNYYYGANVAVTNAAHAGSFVSPQPYPGSASAVWVFDPVTSAARFYQVLVQPWLTYPN